MAGSRKEILSSTDCPIVDFDPATDNFVGARNGASFRRFRGTTLVPADSSVTLAKLADGTAGTVLGYDNEGLPVFKVVGDESDANGIATIGNIRTYATRAVMAGAYIPASSKRVWRQAYSDAISDGGSPWKRVSSEPSDDYKVRSLDRYLPDGSVSSANGGWWAIDLTEVTPQQIGAVGDGVTDDTAAIQGAFSRGGLVQIPIAEVSYRITDVLHINKETTVIGGGCASLFGQQKGSLFFYDHPGRGIEIIGSEEQTISGVFLDGFASIRDQPNPVSGWAPGDYDYDLYIDTADVHFGTLGFVNPTKAIRVGQAGNGYTAFSGYRLWGQPLREGLRIDQLYRHPIITGIEWWPYWSDSAYVHAYTDQYLDGIYSFRCDAAQIGSIFSIRGRRTLRFGENASGVSLGWQIGRLLSDLTVVALETDASVVNGNTVTIDQLYHFGNSIASGVKAINLLGYQTKVHVGALRASESSAEVVNVDGGAKLTIGGMNVVNSNLAGGSAALIIADSASEVCLSSPPVIEGNTNGAALFSGAGILRAPGYNPVASRYDWYVGTTLKMRLSASSLDAPAINAPGFQLSADANGILNVGRFSSGFGGAAINFNGGATFGVFQLAGTTQLTLLGSGRIKGSLPTSSSGLASGEWWSDPAAGYAIKQVP